MTEELKKEFSKLRFLDENGEFYSEWEEKKLGEVLSPIKYKKVANPSSYNLLTVKLHLKGIVPTSNRPNDTENGRPYYKRELGELLVGRQNFHNGGFGIVESNTAGLIASNAISGYKSNENVYFAMYYLRYAYKSFSMYLEGTGQKEIPQKVFESVPFVVPSLPEQEKIANFLSKIDEKIEAQAKLVELLKKQKQGYSQKIFNGSLRFKKDDGTDYEDWEEKKLNEIGIDFKTGKKDANEGSLSGKYNFYTCSSSISHIDDFSFEGPSLLIAGNGIIGDVKYYDGKFDAYQRVYVLQNFTKSSPHYLKSVIKYNLERIIRVEQMGSTLKYIRLSTLTDMLINLPSLPEQEKIAAFLSNLDNRIDQQLNKLEELKQEKQAYMQRVLG